MLPAISALPGRGGCFIMVGEWKRPPEQLRAVSCRDCEEDEGLVAGWW